MTDPVPRLNAALEGRYRIERQLGEGGMATVYLADDLRHDRKVALKVLKPELAAVVGADRFLAEIKTTANLQHPHILPLFDSGEADSFLFYVMPYVEGESLRERIDGEHQLPVDEAVQIAKNVAEALDYAHAHGVLHRDIKPANILLQAGKPVISDFGIALAVGVAGGGRLTETGLSLGTPHYMSPEQATGDMNVGAATDVYALGCVLYETLVGHPPYLGATAQAILGKIVTGDADPVTKHRRAVPGHVDGAIRQALEKVPADRFAKASDFARALSDAGFRYGPDAAAGGAVRGGPWRAVAAAATALAAGLALALVWTLSRPAPAVQVARFSTPFEEGQGPGTIPFMDLSPDGSSQLYMGGGSNLWLDSAPVPLVASPEFSEVSPALSPDGRWLAYASNRTGRYEVYVRPFPNVDSTRIAVSREGRQQPRWAHSGEELFFLDGEGALVSAQVQADTGFRVLGSRTLFQAYPQFAVGGDGETFGGLDSWDVSPDDQRFVMLRVGTESASSGGRIVLVQNFFTALLERVGTQ